VSEDQVAPGYCRGTFDIRGIEFSRLAHFRPVGSSGLDYPAVWPWAEEPLDLDQGIPSPLVFRSLGRSQSACRVERSVGGAWVVVNRLVGSGGRLGV